MFRCRWSLILIWKKSCFELRKWISNDDRVLNHVQGSISQENFIRCDSQAPAKTPGLLWCHKTDSLFYDINPETSFSLRLLSPCTIVSQCILQSYGIGRIYMFPMIFEPPLFKRFKFSSSHTFSDSSEQAYGGCPYLRSVIRLGTVTVSLLCAKTKISSLKHTTASKLELCGALISARLIELFQNLC